MSKMLIMTGPQGSGNHLFSKVFALHEDVYGWKTLLNTYWEGHHHEPFAKYWGKPHLLEQFDWTQSDYYVTSISCPFYTNGMPLVPDYQSFIEQVQEYCDVEIALIGRDQNIVKSQQERVRGSATLDIALQEYKFLTAEHDVHFLSQELLYMYKGDYLEQLSRQLDFPIAYYDPEVEEILKADANEKYIKKVHEYWLDFEVHRAQRES